VEFITQNMWFMVRSIILIFVAVYLGLTIVLFFFQSHLVYYPVREIEATPGGIGLVFEEIVFETKDGIKLHGWFIPASESKGTIMMCHGNGGNISHRLETISIFNRFGMSVVIFDYRGYGKSSGKPGEQGTYTDAEAVLHWITETQNKVSEDVIFFGRSLGGAVAAWLARKYTPKALILESAFTSIPDMGSELYPWIPVRLFSRFKYTTIDYVKEVKCPVLILHSMEDDLVPFSHGKRLFDTAPEPKEFIKLTGTHNDGFLTSGTRYTDGLQSFLMRYGGT